MITERDMELLATRPPMEQLEVWCRMICANGDLDLKVDDDFVDAAVRGALEAANGRIGDAILAVRRRARKVNGLKRLARKSKEGE